MLAAFAQLPARKACLPRGQGRAAHGDQQSRLDPKFYVADSLFWAKSVDLSHVSVNVPGVKVLWMPDLPNRHHSNPKFVITATQSSWWQPLAGYGKTPSSSKCHQQANVRARETRCRNHNQRQPKNLPTKHTVLECGVKGTARRTRNGSCVLVPFRQVNLE